MGKGKSINWADKVLELFLDNMKADFPNQIMIDEQAEDSMNKDNMPKVATSILPLPPQEHCLLPHQWSAWSNPNLKKKQINKGIYDQ